MACFKRINPNPHGVSNFPRERPKIAVQSSNFNPTNSTTDRSSAAQDGAGAVQVSRPKVRFLGRAGASHDAVGDCAPRALFETGIC